MKKFVKVAALALVAVLALAALVACGPSTDPQKAAKALEDKGYAVVAIIGSDSTAKQLILDGIAKVAGLEAGDITATVEASNGNESITITYFKNASVAKSYWDSTDGSRTEKEGWVSKRSGSVIYTGTEQAVKDAR